MIQVDQKENIRRLYFIKRHSVRQIAKELGHSRKTIRKAISDASVPHYNQTAARPSLVMGPYMDIVKEWLETDKSRPSKQRHTAHRIYVRLTKELGFTGAERTVREHVAKLRPTITEMAIPLEFDPGTDAQCDWGEAQVRIAGKLTIAQVLCMKLSFSGRPFVMAFPTQRQEAFFEGQRRAFEWYEGVPGRVSYDNLTVAVHKVLRGRNREEQNAYIGFRSHYLFDSHFAMVATPREQGRVENLVGYMRRNYFVPVPEVESYEELNEKLLWRLLEDDSRLVPGKEITVKQAWETEKPKLRPLPRFPHRCCISRPVKASRLSLVNFDSNRYSVPVEYGFGRLTLHAYAWSIEIVCGDRIIATHERCYDRGKEITEVDHYLPLLLRRPGAFPYARPVRQWKMPPVYRDCYEALCSKHNGYGVREFLQVLALGRQFGKAAVESAMAQVLEENQVSSDRIRQLLNTNSGEITPTVWTGNLGQVKVVFPDLNQFDRLRDLATAGRPE
ncbi:IS21 family transposase [Dehalococcoides mccartyi]|uniref:IS21 family transposase n=1 Tax=Dehalococcoides mccartyi TaxID=61435 RepID=UPI0002B76BDF|nr:IS21 family transposase [Dehalococcoides mccartyi]AGG05959.1 integrase core domain-containing protein [Dehalococcoides mccartyi DCMB5]